ncbi:MAG: hypothetical protein U9N35_00720 [Euryarchaeota archaeon]|nr:hypothetical protein [Euryarchaeota archaeon]
MKKSKEIASLEKRLSDIASLKRRIRMFPTPYFSELRKKGAVQESFEIRHATSRYYRNLNAEIQEDLDGNKKLKLGKDDYIEDYRIDSKEKLEYVHRTIDGKKFSKNEEILIRVPMDNGEVKEIHDIYKADIKKLEEMPTVKKLEKKLNQLIYDLYKLNDKGIGVVENFLEKF